MSENRIKLTNVVENQLPEYIKEEFPLFSEFLNQYYISNEYQGSAFDLIQNIDNYIKLDNCAENIDYVILKDDISFFDDVILVDLEKNPTGTQGFPKSYGLLQIDDEIIAYKEVTENSFVGCIRGFSGITSYESDGASDQLIFKDSESDNHQSGVKIVNLSILFLKEFLKKVKYQLLPGFESKNLYSSINEKLFIKQGKDFYTSKGTDASFEILFKCLYGENIKIIRPKEYLFNPSDAQYNITYDFVVESIEGNPLDLINSTLYQDAYEYGTYTKSYAPITNVETIFTKSGEKYYRLSLDAGYSRDIIVDGSIYGEFSIHPKTKVIDDHPDSTTVITVDSTLGFPENGHLSVTYSDTTTGIVSYTSKSINQFFNCSTINGDGVSAISNGSIISINTFAYGKSSNIANKDEIIKVRINSVLNNFEVDQETDNFYHTPNTKISIKSLGYNDPDNFAFNNWIFNTSPTYKYCSVELTNSAEKKYTITTKTNNILQKGDFIEIESINQSNIRVNEIFNKKSFSVSGLDLSTESSYSIRRKISKVTVDSSEYSDLLLISSDVQNIYKKDNQLIIASNSLPKYEDQPLTINDYSVIGNFIGISTIRIQNGHYFQSGDIIYFTPANNEKAPTLLEEGIYFIKKINDTDICLSKSRSSVYKSEFIQLNLDENSTYNDADGCKIEFYNFNSKKLSPQKLIRVIPTPTNDSDVYESLSGATGILINGTEILNYKSTDKIYYGEIEGIEILSSKNDYDIINPPILKIEDTLGSGCSGYCSVEGGLDEIEVIDPGFDYLDTPIINITGGNGSGAKAIANIKLFTHEVLFNAQSNVSIGNSFTSKIGFSTYHKFRNGERVIYNTNGYSSIGGLSTSSLYYISVKSPTEIQLHTDLNTFNSGIGVSFNSLGTGEQKITSYNKKIKLGSISVVNSGIGYQNKKRTTTSSGINTFFGFGSVFIENHGYKSGEKIKYYFEGSQISGLSTGKEYYITKLDENNFAISEIGIGITEENFYYKSAQYINFVSTGIGTHIFNYPEISVEVIGDIGVSTIGGSISKDIFKSRIRPKFRGEITSIYLDNKGSNYGSPDILNFNRLPEVYANSGFGAVLTPIIDNGKIVDVSIISSGQDYNSSPTISIFGEGIGAVLNAIINDGKIVSVKVIENGIGYNSNTTKLIVNSNGSGVQFYPKIQTWTINLFERFKQSFINIDDGILFNSINSDAELEYGHLFYPRKFKEILKDNIDPNTLSHSPLIGWAYDGNPIYGPYGYSKNNGSGGIVQLNSSYLLNNSSQVNRPNFPLGFFVEDYEYKNKNSENYLDEYNGRFCVTPEFPLGVYAYFSTFDTNASGEFNGYKLPRFPYFIGNFYRSKPNGFNFVSTSNQDKINLNEIKCLRNTYSYGLTDEYIDYEYLNTKDYKAHTSNIKSVSSGYLENIQILNSGDNYNVGDNIVFDNTGTSGYGAAVKVSKVSGKEVQTISVATTSVNNVEFYPNFKNNSFLGIFKDPHQFNDNEIVSIGGLSTSKYTFAGVYSINVPSNFLILRENISNVSVTGIITYFPVHGNIDNFQSNDILGIGTEKIKILEIDKLSSRIKVLRSAYGTVGSAHSSLDILQEKSTKIIFNTYSSPKFNYKLNNEIYFDPKESLGLGLGLGVGIGYTLSFSNPGSGITSLYIPTKTIYLPNHGLETGDELTYSSNGSSTIEVSINGISNFSLSDNSKVFVARISDNIIGISTVKVGVGSTGGFVGVTSTTKTSTTLYFSGIGTGNNHSFKTNYDKISGTVSKNIVTVSAASTHGLETGDIVSIDVNPKLSTIIPVQYNNEKRRVVLNPRSFVSSGINTSIGSIDISNHGFTTGQKIIYKTDYSTAELKNNEIYYILVIDENTIKLSNSYYDSISPNPKTISITSTSNGSISPINPPIKVYKESQIIFDLSDYSLSYTVNNNQYSAFKFELYTDPYFKNIFKKPKDSESFVTLQQGSIGISTDAKFILNVNNDFPERLYYKLSPVFTDGISYPENKKEIIVDNLLINSNNTLEILKSGYIGEYKIFVGVGSTSSFEYILPNKPEIVSYSSTISNIIYQTSSLNAFGPISDLTITDPGKNYYSLPKIIEINSNLGKNGLVDCSSETIGKIKSTEINNIGFDFSSDYTLLPENYPVLIIKVESLYSIDEITVSSFGINYNIPPKLVTIDQKTNQVITDLDLEYSLNDNIVKIIKNTSNLSGLIPKIIPTENNNGFRITDIQYNSSTKLVTITFTYTGSFPFSINDKVLVENVIITDSENKGYDSKNYNYELFSVISLTEDIGLEQGTITYSLKDYLTSTEYPGVFDYTNTIGRIIPEKYFPIFNTTIKRGEYSIGENIKSEYPQKLEGYVSNWDGNSGLLTISDSTKKFNIGEIIQGESTNSKSKILNIYITNSITNLSTKTKINKGWQKNTGFLNDNAQKIQDSFYYQNFSYSIKSKVDYNKWKDDVLTLNHPKGFKVFSDYQLESNQYAGISTSKPTELLVTLDIVSKSDFNNYYFDLSSENSFNLDSTLVSNEIIFKNKLVKDYILSIGNRVLNIDDISSQFDNSKKSFLLNSDGYPLFKTTFDGSSVLGINTGSNTIKIDNHFYVTGEKIFYSNGTNSNTNSIGIASTDFGVGIGITDKLPSQVYVVKISDNEIKFARNAEDALSSTPKTLDIVSVGIGTTHYFSCFDQNSRVLVSIDGIIQSPIAISPIKSYLASNVSISTSFVYLTGITSFFNGEFIKIDDEIMNITSVGIGSTNLLKVNRSLLGTQSGVHTQGSTVTKIVGDFNIVENTINFSSPPLELSDPLDATISQKSKFHGRSFVKSGFIGQNRSTYSNNYIFDDISNSFSGISSGFVLKNDNSNITGISTDNIILLINNIPQVPSITANQISQTNNYYLTEKSGITTVFFVGSNNIPNQGDINTANLPINGVIVSVGSTSGFGYQPLVSAGGTVTVSISGTISSVSIGNSGSGYRTAAQGTIRVGVITSNINQNKIVYIGTASINKGNIVGVSITNPGSGYTSTNPPTLVIDAPLPYSNIPLVYSSKSSGIGTEAKIDIVVGNGSSIINFEMKNFGYNYKKGDILTVPIGGTAGIPTDTTKQFDEFNIFISEVKFDKFSGWFIGNLKVFDDISGLFNGVRKVFPLSVGNERYSLTSQQGSKIDLKLNLLVFLNDVLQIPDESYIFDRGDSIIFNEAPKGKSSDNVISGDKCKIIFYAGNVDYDIITKNIVETIKEGDELQLSYNISLGQPQSLQEDTRIITSLYPNSAETQLYFGFGISTDQTLYRPTFWRKQTEDKIIDSSIVSKNRVFYEPAIYPSSYIINSVGINSTIVYVDNIRPFFNSKKESFSGNYEFQNKIILLSQDTNEFCTASSNVSLAGTVTSISIINSGNGYTTAPSVILESPVGLGTTYRATASSTISEGKVTNISINYPGSMYESSNPPQVLVEPPSSKKEVCDVIGYFGDQGIITGIGTTSIVGVAATGLVFDLFIPNNSYLRDISISGIATDRSGIKTGDYFVVYNSKVGNGVTSLDSTGSIVGVGTSRLDNVYIARSVSIASSYVPSGGQQTIVKVVVSLSSYNNLTGLGFSDFYGEYSWGKIEVSGRSSSNQYNSYRNKGVVGLNTSALSIRYNSLKYSGYVS